MRVDMFLPRHCIAALFLLALPVVVQAEFIFTTNNGAIIITGYNGPGGVVVIPDATNGYPVTGVADFAFEDGANLTSVTIPGSVTNIGEGPFLGCTSLTNISVNAGNPSYSSKNGVLLDIANPSQGVLVAYPAGLTNGTYSNSIPEIAGIADYAFADCSSLTNVTVSVPSIGDYAFIGCTGLTDVTIGNNPWGAGLGLRYSGPINVGEAAFSGCTSLSNVFIGDVTNIEGLAFAFCTNLTVAYFQGNAPPNDGTAFYGDPDAIVYYELGAAGWGPAFGGAPTVGEMSLLDFYDEIIDGSVTITECLDSGAVVIPAYIFGYPVSSIGNGQSSAFPYNVTSVVIPDTITSIGAYAFEDCWSLTTVTIPNSVASIGEEAFETCIGLTNIVIPNSVTDVGTEAFYLCSSLTSAYFEGKAPPDVAGTAFAGDLKAVVYYLPGTTGWGTTFGGAPIELWNPQAIAFTTAGDQFGFNITGPTNATIVVEACTNLANPVWLPVSTNTLSDGESSFSDPQRANYPNRFYRFSAP